MRHLPIHFDADRLPPDTERPCPRNWLPVRVASRAAPITRATRYRGRCAKVTGAQIDAGSARAVEGGKLLGQSHVQQRKNHKTYSRAHCWSDRVRTLQNTHTHTRAETLCLTAESACARQLHLHHHMKTHATHTAIQCETAHAEDPHTGPAQQSPELQSLRGNHHDTTSNTHTHTDAGNATTIRPCELRLLKTAPLQASHPRQHCQFHSARPPLPPNGPQRLACPHPSRHAHLNAPRAAGFRPLS